MAYYPEYSHHPHITVGPAPALPVSRPAQRSLTLQRADSPSRLMRPSTPEVPAALLPPTPLRLLPGGAIQFPVGSFLPPVDQRLSRRTVKAVLVSGPGFLSYGKPSVRS
jgi:hypothetical protein